MFRFILLFLPSVRFPRGFDTKIVYAFHVFPSVLQASPTVYLYHELSVMQYSEVLTSLLTNPDI